MTRSCSRCGAPGHYAPTCTRLEAAPRATRASTGKPAPPPPPPPTEAFRDIWEAFVRAAPATRLAVVQYELPGPLRTAVAHLLAGNYAPFAVRCFLEHLSTLERAIERHRDANPWEHVLREQWLGTDSASSTSGAVGAGDPFAWRHTWRHAVTGAWLVVTVPMPPSGCALDAAVGLVARRFLSAPPPWPGARVVILSPDGAAASRSAVSTAPPAPSVHPAPPVGGTVGTDGAVAHERPLATMTFGVGMF